MKKKFLIFILVTVMAVSGSVLCTNAATDTYTVVKGDSLWKISVKYQVGLSEIISANPQFKNPNLIYPGDKVYVPLLDTNITSYEQQVIDLVNQIRVQNGLAKFTTNWQLSRVARY